jgi:hypothetical protein
VYVINKQKILQRSSEGNNNMSTKKLSELTEDDKHAILQEGRRGCLIRSIRLLLNYYQDIYFRLLQIKLCENDHHIFFQLFL